MTRRDRRGGAANRTASVGAAFSLLALLAGTHGCAPDRPAATAAAVVDDRGRPHDATRPRTRVISLIPAMTETLVAIGAGDRLVARTRYDEDPVLADLPSVGGGIDPSLEFLARLDPDLVVLWASGASGVRLEDRLDEIGLDWYGAAARTVDDFRRHARNLGRLVGLADRADSVIARVEGDLEAAAELWSGNTAVEVVYVVQRDPPMTTGPGTFLDSLLAAAGAVNAFGDIAGSWPLVSIEEVVRRNPAYVVVPVRGYGVPRVPSGYRDPSAERLGAHPGWAVVPAVVAGRVISVDATLFGRPGPRMGGAALYLATRLHGASRPGAVPPHSPAGADSNGS